MPERARFSRAALGRLNDRRRLAPDRRDPGSSLSARDRSESFMIDSGNVVPVGRFVRAFQGVDGEAEALDGARGPAR